MARLVHGAPQQPTSNHDVDLLCLNGKPLASAVGEYFAASELDMASSSVHERVVDTIQGGIFG